jgi:hypothetical protein
MAKAEEGEAIGLLPDQVPQEGEGVWAKFLVSQRIDDLVCQVAQYEWCADYSDLR